MDAVVILCAVQNIAWQGRNEAAMAVIKMGTRVRVFVAFTKGVYIPFACFCITGKSTA